MRFPSRSGTEKVAPDKAAEASRVHKGSSKHLLTLHKSNLDHYTAAAIVTQSHFRGYVVRHKRGLLNLTNRVHLGYELKVLQERKRRRNLIKGFPLHLTYMLILFMVFVLQHGRTVQTRFVLVETLKDYINGLETPSKVTFASIGSTSDCTSHAAFPHISARCHRLAKPLMHPHTVWDWTTNAFFNEFGGSDRVFVRSASSTAHPRRTPSHSLGEPKA